MDRIIFELKERRRVGAQMANFCFNLGQDSSPSTPPPDWPKVKELLKSMFQSWDAIASVTLNEINQIPDQPAATHIPKHKAAKKAKYL